MQPAISAGVISELVSLVQVHFGPRLSAVYLCSEPIFDADDSSDLELLAVLDEPGDRSPKSGIWGGHSAISASNIRRTASVYPFSQQGFDEASWFFARAKQTAKRVA